MKKILWMSRHSPLDRQLDWLLAKFGEIEVKQDPTPFSSAEDIATRFEEGGYDEMVVVAPLSVIARLIDLKIRPLWSEMEEVSLDQAEVRMNRRGGRQQGYRFVTFKRISALRLEFEEL